MRNARKSRVKRMQRKYAARVRLQRANTVAVPKARTRKRATVAPQGTKLPKAVKRRAAKKVKATEVQVTA